MRRSPYLFTFIEPSVVFTRMYIFLIVSCELTYLYSFLKSFRYRELQVLCQNILFNYITCRNSLTDKHLASFQRHLQLTVMKRFHWSNDYGRSRVFLAQSKEILLLYSIYRTNILTNIKSHRMIFVYLFNKYKHFITAEVRNAANDFHWFTVQSCSCAVENRTETARKMHKTCTIFKYKYKTPKRESDVILAKTLLK